MTTRLIIAPVQNNTLAVIEPPARPIECAQPTVVQPRLPARVCDTYAILVFDLVRSS